MAYIDNSETKKELNDAIRGNAVSNIAPTQLANQVIPVINVNPKDYRICNINKTTVATNSTSAVIYTTPADKDFFITACSLTVIKDATSTSTLSRIKLTIDGAEASILPITTLTLTAQDSAFSISFPNPIKIDRDSIISITNSTNVANISTRASIHGYTVEP